MSWISQILGRVSNCCVFVTKPESWKHQSQLFLQTNWTEINILSFPQNHLQVSLPEKLIRFQPKDKKRKQTKHYLVSLHILHRKKHHKKKDNEDLDEPFQQTPEVDKQKEPFTTKEKQIKREEKSSKEDNNHDELTTEALESISSKETSQKTYKVQFCDLDQ